MSNSKQAIRLLIIAIANNEIGFGHLNRCISIAATSIEKGLKPSFILFGDEVANQFMQKTAYHFELHAGTNVLQTIENIGEESTQAYDLAIVDIVHPVFFKKQENLEALFKAISTLAIKTAAIDSLGKKSIAINVPKALLNTLVVPYVLSDDIIHKLQNIHPQCLYGEQYALLSPIYLQCPGRHQRLAANRILITSGGGDPKQLTPVVLQALEKLEITLEIRVVVGPFFNKRLTQRIIELSDNSAHKISVLLSPNTLKEHMLWSDLAISASGLTKYELAATGTPSILFSIDEIHNLANQPFANLGISVDLGVMPSHEQFTKATSELLMNTELRNRMSIRGQQSLDGKGSDRLLTELIKGFKC